MTGLVLALALAAQAVVPPPLAVEGDPATRLVWVRSFASAGDDWINDIVPLGGGRHLAVGFLDRGDGSDWRALAASFGEDGTMLSTREYGQGGGIDAFWNAAPAAEGGLAFAGFTTRIGAGGIDAWALFADAAGAMLREQSFGGAGYDRFTDVAAAADGHVFIGHSQPPGEERRRLFAVRTDADGTTRWERIIEGPESISPLYIEPAGDGGFIVAGGIGGDILVMKLDGDGRELWRRAVGTPEADDTNHGLALRPNGKIVVVGYSQSWGARGNDILAVTLSSGGDVLSREMYGGAGDDRPRLVTADARGRMWIVGSTTSAGAGGSDALLVRLDASGRFEPGAVTIGGPADEIGTTVRRLADGSALVAGYGTAPGAGGEDAFVARVSAPGFDRAHPAFVRRAIP